MNVISFCQLAPVPLTLYQLNLKFDQNLQCSGLKYSQLITTKFYTHHNSAAVVTHAKFRCNQLSIF